MKIAVDFKEVGIKDIKPDKTSFDILLTFLEDEKLYGIQRKLGINDNVEEFVKNLLQELKTKIKEKYEDPLSEDLLDRVNISFVEKGDGEAEEKIVNVVKKLKDSVRNLKTMRVAEEYMNTFLSVRDMKIKIK